MKLETAGDRPRLSLLDEVILLRASVRAIDDLASYKLDRDLPDAAWSQVYRLAHAAVTGRCFQSHSDWRQELRKEKDCMQDDIYVIVGTNSETGDTGILETSQTEDDADAKKSRLEAEGYTNVRVVDTRKSEVWL